MESTAPTDAPSHRLVPLDELDLAPWLQRGNETRDELTALVRSIAEHGLLHPPIVREMPDGSLQLYVGSRRYLAAMGAAEVAIEVSVRTASDVEALAMSLAENDHRSPLSAWEESHRVALLADAIATETGKAPSRDEIAQRISWSAGRVSESLRIAHAITPDVLEAASTDGQALTRLSKAALLAAAQGGGVEEIAARLRAAIEEGATAEEMATMAKAAKPAPRARERSTPTTVVGQAIDAPRRRLADIADATGISLAALEKYRAGRLEMPAEARRRVAAYLEQHAREVQELAKRLREAPREEG